MDSRHRRSFRRPGYMRTEALSQLDAAVNLPSNRSCDSHRSHPSTNTSSSELPSSLGEKWLGEVLESDDSSNTPKPHPLHESQVEETSRTVPSCDVFNSSFSFIQRSLETSHLLDTTTSEPSPSLDRTTSESHSSTLKPKISPVPINQSGLGVFMFGHLPSSFGRPVKSKGISLDGESWLRDLDRRWDTQMSSDCGFLDAEVTSSLSVDSSDSTSASSVTSGYDSATPFADHSRNCPKKCEDALQDCLQNNRANAKVHVLQ